MSPLSDPRPLRVLGKDLSEPPTAGRNAAATGLASGEEPLPQLAAQAVHRALEQVGSDCAGSILLFLTSDFSRNTQAAITAASRAGHCLQVTGCCVPGLFTESDWLIDRPGAAALVLCGGLGLNTHDGGSLLSLMRPEASPRLAGETPRFGGVAADAGPMRPARLWQNGKLLDEPICSSALQGATARIGVSRGLCMLSTPARAEVEGYELHRLGGSPALDALLAVLPGSAQVLLNEPPLHLLYAGLVDADADPETALAIGRYTLLPLLAVNNESRTLTLAAPLPAEARLFWALRDPAGAERDMEALLDTLAPVNTTPSFALMFSCMGRGPYFYGGTDRDLDLVKKRFPGMPLLGAYCAGEIAPLPSGNALIHNSVVLALCENEHVQSKP